MRQNAAPDALLIRRELGLATDRPIIMTGHHAEFWHAGILSKYLAADAASFALGAQPAWLVVDQDRAESLSIRYPRRSEGRLTVGTATVRERTPPTATGAADLQIQQRLDYMLTRVGNHPGDLSHRVAAALEELLGPMMAVPAITLFATELNRTTLFQSLVAEMRRDPERCILAYNAAAARHPSAAVRPLIADDIQDRWELPLWHLPPGKPRTHVYAEMNVPVSELAPKALLMTGLMRIAACDLFIHGFGGGGGEGDDREGYDLITEEWLERWLGIPREKIAPLTVVTATRYLPLSPEPPPSPAQVAEALAAAHRARHSPDLLGDHDAELRKRALVRAIADAPRHTHQRHDLYLEMHRLLEESRRIHAPALQQLERIGTELKARLAERDIVYDRTWPFALHSPASLDELRAQVHARFGSEGTVNA